MEAAGSVCMHAWAQEPPLHPQDNRAPWSGLLKRLRKEWWQIQSPQTAKEGEPKEGEGDMRPLLSKIWSLCSPDKWLLFGASLFMVGPCAAHPHGSSPNALDVRTPRLPIRSGPHAFLLFYLHTHSHTHTHTFTIYDADPGSNGRALDPSLRYQVDLCGRGRRCCLDRLQPLPQGALR